MESCSASIGSRSCSAPVMSFALRVVDTRHGSQLGGLLFGSRVIQEIAATDLRSGEILEEPGLAKRWVDLDVEMKAWIRAVSGRLVQHRDVRRRTRPHVVGPDPP